MPRLGIGQRVRCFEDCAFGRITDLVAPEVDLYEITDDSGVVWLGLWGTDFSTETEDDASAEG